MSALFSHVRLLPLALAAALLGACGVDSGSAGDGKSAERAAAKEAEWHRLRLNGQPALVLEAASGRPLAALRCDAAAEILVIDRMLDGAETTPERMTLMIDGRSRRLPVVPAASEPAAASAMMKLEDSHSDGLSRLGSRIEIRLAGVSPLVLPTDRRIGTLIEECRQGQRS